jgi:hypothetical protein
MTFREYFRRGVGVVSGLVGSLAIYTSMAEGVFFEKVMSNGSQEILDHGYTQNAINFAIPLIANGTVKFLDFPIKACLGVIGVVLVYLAISIFINLKNPDFGVRSFFSLDYWIKFNALKYKKTRINASRAN